MLIFCDSCQTRYRIADPPPSERQLSVACRVCKAVISVQGGVRDQAHLSRRNPNAPSPFDDPTNPEPEPPMNAPNRTAPQRSQTDSSTMFSLASLVTGASMRMPSAEPVGRPRETSGLIDLNAIARAAEERARAPKSEPPPAYVRDAFPSEPPPGNKRGVKIIAALAAVGALAVVGVAFGTMHTEDPKPAAAATKPIEAPKPEPVATTAPAPTTPPAATTAADPSKDKSADTSTTQTKGKRGKRGLGGHGSSKLTKISSSGVDAPAARPAPPPKAADPCHCHGDFKCTMACVAK
jgi:hypothetical protein